MQRAVEQDYYVYLVLHIMPSAIAKVVVQI